jgi:hypothetical protein
MRALEPATRKAIRPALRGAGQQVASKAQSNASWSTRIPGTVRVQVSFRQNREGVVIRAGGPNAPHARPYEGLSSGGTSFRHPVHGRDWWVSQAARPFLLPAAESSEGAVTASMREALDAAAQEIGFS